jgi:dethiobiotin synthetase
MEGQMIPPGKGVFITGTDTDAGKTIAAAAVLVSMRASGIDAVPMKPVQTGGRWDRQPDSLLPTHPPARPVAAEALALPSTASVRRDGGAGRWQGPELQSPDLTFCLRMAELLPDPEELKDMAPFIYEPACSPHLAAEKTGREISLDRILEAFRSLLQRHERVVVEGAGGVLAPISGNQTMIDLMAMLGLPIILAARPGLGAINHTLLSIREIERSGLTLYGIIFCETTSTGWGEIEQNNVETISRMGKARVLGRIPYMPEMAETIGISPKVFKQRTQIF